MNANFYKDIAKRRINSIFKLSSGNIEERWKRSFWSISGILTVAMFDECINSKDYKNISCELYNYLEEVYKGVQNDSFRHL